MAKKNDSRLDFLSPLFCVQGLGTKRVKVLKDCGIETIGHLLYHLPDYYIDRSNIVPLKKLPEYIGKKCAVTGTITEARLEQRKKQLFRIQISDNSGTMESLWFHGVTYHQKSLQKGKMVLLYGKVIKNNTCQMIHPLIENIETDKNTPSVPFMPHYPRNSIMRETHISHKVLFNAIKWVLENLKHYPRIIPETIENKYSLPSLENSLYQIHIPSDITALEPFYNRLRFEELYQIALSLRWSRRKFALPGRSLKPGLMAEQLKRQLPFVLTDDQQKVIQILFNDASAPQRMHRLLQGDVGSGKTITALFATLPALNEGLQVAWLAPTEILAQQSFERIKTWLSTFSIKTGLLKSAIPSMEKRNLLASLKSGDLQFVVGTHALIQPSVQFAKLGMIVIDEQHRFGVEQRLAIQEKDPASDFLLMSATPIPQTLARTLYGDLDVVTLNSTPHYRKPVHTHIVPENKRNDMELFVREALCNEKTQAFYIVPRIDCSDEEGNSIKDVTSVYERLRKTVFSDIPAGVIHGRLTSEEKEQTMRKFAIGELKIIVATTVVEVGIDVPDASIMIIENAERFGLSQLHQLRGRVGRAGQKAYTFLLTTPGLNIISIERLKKFCTMHNGFEIADLDLTIRGPGEVTGIKQSGWWDEMKIANILRDSDLFRHIQEDLEIILKGK